MSAGFVDSDLLRSLASSLASVFDNVRLYQPRAGTLLFLATDGPLDLERQLAETNLPLRNNLLHYSYMGLNGAEDLVAALLLDETGLRAFSEGAPLATDDRNRMATDSRSLSDGLDTNALLELVAPLDPLLDAEGWVHTELRERLDFGYIAGRLLAERQAARAGRLANVIADRSTQLYVTGLVHGYLGRLDTAREAFAAALAADPGNSSARYAIVEPELPALASNRASEELTQLARGLPVSAQAVVRGWQLAARRNWDALAALDRSLARAEVTDLWYPESVQLRADWRTQAVGEARHAFDAMRLIDRALSIRPKLELYLLRAASADRLDDDAAFVETSRSLLDFVRSRLEVARDDGNAVTGAELEMIAERLVALRGRLDSMSGAMSGRARTVADAMTTELDNIRRIERARLGGVE
jgi:tetratricopeptide (TPR) repeat protein